jgi:NUC194 domain.
MSGSCFYNHWWITEFTSRNILLRLVTYFIVLFCRNASSAHKEDMRGENMLLELRRIYHCAAYNCMISIISCTQTELKFYTGLLFSDNPAKVYFLHFSFFNFYFTVIVSIRVFKLPISLVVFCSIQPTRWAESAPLW